MRESKEETIPSRSPFSSKDNENKKKMNERIKGRKGGREGNVISLDKRVVTYVSIFIRNCSSTGPYVILIAMDIHVFNVFAYL